jgi:hypothetical protein
MNHSLYVITPVFNPRQFQSRYRLYRDFEKHVADSGAILLTVECAFDKRPFVVTDATNPMHVQLRTATELWHKERLINLGIQHLTRVIPDARFVAWIDADVKFARPDWVKATVDALQHYSVVQPFGEAAHLGPHHEQLWTAPSRFKQFLQRGFHQEPPLPIDWKPEGQYYLGHPGLAWASTVEALNRVGGLLDVCIAGSADSHMANALLGDYKVGFNPQLSEGFNRSIARWQERCDVWIRQNVGFVDGQIMHFWHGKSEQRGYNNRADMIAFHQYDPHEDLVTETSGLYTFSGNKPRLEQDIRLSLSMRNEDSIDL